MEYLPYCNNAYLGICRYGGFRPICGVGSQHRCFGILRGYRTPHYGGHRGRDRNDYAYTSDSDIRSIIVDILDVDSVCKKERDDRMSNKTLIATLMPVVI